MRMKIRGGMILTPRDIQLITGTDCARTARREHINTREALGKKSKRLTIKEYCDYWEIDYEETVTFLNDNR